MSSESLNLNGLASSLPSHSLNAQAEKALLDNFKAAALSITTLYRSSRHASKRAYNSGYAAACRDLLEVLQLGVSDSQVLSGQSSESGMTVGRVMDWLEARLEAVRAREEEEDEEEGVATANNAPAARKPSPSPPPSRTVPPSPPRPSIPLKPARTQKPVASPPSRSQTISPMAPPPDLVTFPFAENVPPVLAGSKRRHAVMLMPTPPMSAAHTFTSTPSSSSSSPSPMSMSHAQAQRRRTRSTRGLFPLNQGPSMSMDALMDIDDDGGRERKRVARR
ncbi:hypothetical protein MKEN_01251500 [Mycena kentingensis (nom. inval.)]|nr:hypothetical protein MKEN_01251500 [Mycena kentingensis (nom. inval.)]